jgi:predicted transcriptional regulator
MTNQELAQIVADRILDHIEEEMMNLVQEITMDVLAENDVDPDADDTWETMMDVAGRIYIGAQ